MESTSEVTLLRRARSRKPIEQMGVEVSARIPLMVRDELEALAVRDQRSVSALVRMAIVAFLAGAGADGA